MVIVNMIIQNVYNMKMKDIINNIYKIINLIILYE